MGIQASVDRVARGQLARFNTDGSLDFTFNPTLGPNDVVYSIAAQADGKLLIGGDFTSVSGATRNYIARLNRNGTLDTTFEPKQGPNGYVKCIAIQNDAKIVIGGAFTRIDGITRTYIARLNPNGSLDPSFDVGQTPNGSVLCVAVAQDQRILIGGTFTRVNGVTCNRIARLSLSGALDASFSADGGAQGNLITDPAYIYSISPQRDGKIFIGGNFKYVNRVARSMVARLKTDGSLDTSFNSGFNSIHHANISDTVYSVAPLTDGNLFIAGTFVTVNDMARPRLAKLNPNGTLNTGFMLRSGADGGISCLALQSDKKILVGGSFNYFDGVKRNLIARLNADGKLDTAFDAGAIAAPFDGLYGGPFISSVALTSDTRIIVGGRFETIKSEPRKHVVRLMQNGSIDAGFDTGLGPNNVVFAVCVQPDGKVLIGGAFTNVNGVSSPYLARLSSDGRLDRTFENVLDVSPNSPGPVRAIVMQPDGGILVGGSFRSRVCCFTDIIRLLPDGRLDTSFVPNSGIVSVRQIARQADGKILLTAASNLSRVNSNGARDASFKPDLLREFFADFVAVLGNGQILVAGSYLFRGRNTVVRLNRDGLLDTSFNADVEGSGAMLLQRDGKLLIAGISSVDAVPRSGVARLNGVWPTSLGISQLSSGRARLHIDGPTSEMLTIQSSTNLKQWSQFMVLPNPETSLDVDFPMEPFKERYYRTVSQ